MGGGGDLIRSKLASAGWGPGSRERRSGQLDDLTASSASRDQSVIRLGTAVIRSTPSPSSQLPPPSNTGLPHPTPQSQLALIDTAGKHLFIHGGDLTNLRRMAGGGSRGRSCQALGHKLGKQSIRSHCL